MAISTQLTDRIDKLNGDNYRSWKFNMKMILVQRELWQHATSEVEEPVDDLEQLENFKSKNDKASAAIALCIEPEHQMRILDCVKASDAWETLRKIFEPDHVREYCNSKDRWYRYDWNLMKQ